MIKSEVTLKDPQIELLHNNIIQSIQDTKGENIVKLDLRKLDEAPCNFFIICEANNRVQVRAIAQNIKKATRDNLSVRPSYFEGDVSGHWIVVDYFNTVVHVFYSETRSFYRLEDLWSDAHFEYIEEDAI